MSTALPIYQEEREPVSLPPRDKVGKRFIERFPNYWGFIEAEAPESGEKARWRTETRYPLEARVAWKKYLDEDILLGVRFVAYTLYLLLDIDRGSEYHPANNREKFDGIIAVLESIGLCRVIPVRSSESEGIHLYCFFPYGVHSFTAAVAVEQALLKAGYKMKAGQLESFPNAKYYRKGQVSNFNAHRLPLQSGSFVLDWDLVPISNSVESFLNYADWAGKGQDMEALGEAMEEAREWVKKNRWYRKKDYSEVELESDLSLIIAEGWSGHGQTNDLLLKMAMYGKIFKRLKGEELVRYVVATAESSEGYRQWCRHQHEIVRRAAEVSNWAESYPYTDYASSPPRHETYANHFKNKNKVVGINHNEVRHLETLARVSSVIEELKAEGELPKLVCKCIELIRKKSKERHSIGVSKETLYKWEYKQLWHPEHRKGGVNADKLRHLEQILPDPWLLPERYPRVEDTRVSESLRAGGLYEGRCVLCLPAGRADSGCTSSTGEGSLCEPSGQGEEEVLSENLELIFLLTTLQTLSISNLLGSSVNLNNSISLTNPLNNLVKEFNYFLCALIYLIEFNGEKNYKEELLGSFNDLIYKPLLEFINKRKEVLKAFWDYKFLLYFLSRLGANSKMSENLASRPRKFAGFGRFEQPPPVSASGSNYEGEDYSLPYRQAIKLRSKAHQQSKHLIRLFCQTNNVDLLPQVRQLLVDIVRNLLKRSSSSSILQAEAGEWFEEHKEEIAQINDFDVFWEYFEYLL